MLRRNPRRFDSHPSQLRASFTRLILPCLMAIPLLNLAADGQTPKTEQSKGTPIVRVTTRLVEVSVLVHDKKGISVSGLTKDDFELLDNGKPQQIGLFSEKSNHPLTGKSIALPSGTFSNRPAMEGNVTTAATVILFDALNTDFSSQADVRNRMIEFMKAQLKANDKIAIYLLGRDLRVVHDFTGEPSSLLAALIQNKPFPVPEYTPPNLSTDMPFSGGAGAGGSGSNGPLTSQMQQAQQAIALMSAEVGAFYARLHVDLTTNALIAIANHLRNIPGTQEFDLAFGRLSVGNRGSALHYKYLLSPARHRKRRAP